MSNSSSASNGVNLRRVLSEDAEADEFCQMVNEHVAHAYPLNPKDLADSRSRFFWVRQDNRVVGSTGYTLRTPTLCEVRKTMILPSYRRRGLCIKACDQLEELCVREGVRKSRVTVFADNREMLCLRLAIGYVIEGFHPDHEAPGYHEYSLGKLLVPADELTPGPGVRV